MSGHAMWALGTVLTVGVLGGGAAVWSADDARKSVVEWGAGVVDHPIDDATYDMALHRWLAFDLNAVVVDTPAAVSVGLTQHAAWWRVANDATFILGQPYSDGMRPAELRYSRPDGTVKRIVNGAFPVQCPDPRPAQICYHAATAGDGIEAHLLLTLSHDNVDVSLHASALLLFDGTAVFQAGGGPLARLNGESIHSALATLALASGQPRTFASPADTRRWAIEGYATATASLEKTLGPHYRPADMESRSAVDWFGQYADRRFKSADSRKWRTFLEDWRMTNAHLMRPSPQPHPNRRPLHQKRGWTHDDKAQAIKTWGAGVIDRPVDVEPTDPVTHRELVFKLSGLEISAPAMVSADLTRHAQWWRTATDVRVSLGFPRRDGERLLRVDFGRPTRANKRRGIYNPALPVVCPDPARDRTCYHAALRDEGVEIHLLLTLEHDESDVDLHASALLMFDHGAVFKAAGGPLARLHREPMDTVLSALMEAADPAPNDVQSLPMKIEGSATAQIDDAWLSKVNRRREFADDASVVDRLRDPRWFGYLGQGRRQRSIVKQWRTWNAR